MLKHRIVPVLLWDGDQVVQSVQFNRPHRKCGSMQEHIANMERRNVDELIILDVNATLESREPKFKEIRKYAEQLFCPVTYGGGISKIEHVDKLIQECGVDKVAIKSNYLKITPISYKYGTQAVVASVDHAYGNAQYGVLNNHDHINDPFTVEGWCKRLEDIGAGEILLTDILCNGKKEGYAIGLTHTVVKKINIPVITNGGCGAPEHMQQAFEAGASACAASSMFLFTEHTPRSVARELREAGVAVRVDG